MKETTELGLTAMAAYVLTYLGAFNAGVQWSITELGGGSFWYVIAWTMAAVLGIVISERATAKYYLKKRELGKI